VFGPPQYMREGIPQPIVDSAAEGWLQYQGNGRFVTESGREFFWRDGRFVNADGTMMDLPASAKEHLNRLGVYAQPTIPPKLDSDKAALVSDAERIPRGIIDETLVFEWQPAPGSDLPADPTEALDAIQKSAFDPDVVVYLKDSGTPDALIQHIDAMPEVQFNEFVSKENLATIKVWLHDRGQSVQVVEELRGREEVREVRSASVDFVSLTALLRNAAHTEQ